MEWLMIPAYPSLVSYMLFFFNRGNIEWTNSLEEKKFIFAYNVLFYICVGICGFDLRKGLHNYDKSFEFSFAYARA